MLDVLLSGILTGNTYALIALGLSLIVGIANVINFAHGAILAVGAMVSWWATSQLGLSFWVGLLAAIVVSSALGWVINIVAVRPFSAKAPIAAILSTIAVMILLDNSSQLVFGPETRRFDSGLPNFGFTLGSIHVGIIDIIILVTGLLSMGLLAAFLKFTRVGRGIRAASQDREAAALMGVNVNRAQSITWIIASALGGIAGVLVAFYFANFNPAQGTLAGMGGIAAATLGGLGSLPGAVVGGFIVGILEAFGIYFFGDSVRHLIVFGVMLLVLWIRPSGLFAKTPAIMREPLTGTFFTRGIAIKFKRWQIVVLIAAAAALAIPGLASGYMLQIGIQVIAYAIICLSMVVIGGHAGQFALGQAAPVAIGAYATGILMKNAGMPFVPALLISGLVAAVVMIIFYVPSWRLTGHYPAIATLATASVIMAIILVWEPLTGGARGIAMIPLPDVFGIKLDTQNAVYLTGLVLLLICLGLTVALLRSHVGRFWRAIRDDEVAARSAGIATPQYKSLAFGFGGFLAGIGGSYLAGQYGYIDVKMFTFLLSFQIIIIAVLGSLVSPFGAIVGATILVAGLEFFRFATDLRLLIYGVVLLLLIYLRPQGLWTRMPRRSQDESSSGTLTAGTVQLDKFVSTEEKA